MIGAVWEAALEIRLERKRAGFYMPGAIGLLCPQQIIDATFPSGTIGIEGAGHRGRVQTLAGGIGIARKTGKLRPAAVGALMA